MGLRDLEIKEEYRIPNDNIIESFYIPLLKEAVIYKRAVGFFSSTLLSEISYGISELVMNHGKIKIVASPRLSDEDIEAIKKGYEERNNIIKNNLFKELEEPLDKFQKKRLNLLAYLISKEILDIRIAFTENENNIGIYHEKMGIFEDIFGDKVAFSGSMNETLSAVAYNYETIDVYNSWEDKKRIKLKEDAFNKIWNNEEASITVVDFPELKEEIIKRYKYEEPDFNIDEKERREKEEILCRIEENKENKKNIPKFPKGFELYDYQKEAIETWKAKKFCGIFDMATGTGKTYTGLSALKELYEFSNAKLAIVIVCPFQHLVEQWVEDIEKFNIEPIIGYSASRQKDWKNKLKNSIRYKYLKVEGYEFFCFICTNATFASKFVQEGLKKLKEDLFIMVDEAHNFGSGRLSKLLDDKYGYRLALSATLERQGDEEGTEKLYNFFGEKCIEYNLKRAIDEKKLTNYKYYPVIVYLTEDELLEYKNLSYEISKCVIIGKNGKEKLSEYGEILSIQRARIVAGAFNKLDALRKEIKKYKKDNFILVYCGAASIALNNDENLQIEDEEMRQIDEVTKILGNELDMKVAQFTSREDIKYRSILKEEFKSGESLQALIAIKCLDEGVNIPGIKTAFILASTTNPKEYIQRRGRVLRLSEGKEFAEIYDFITLPRKVDEVRNLSREELKYELSLVKKEIKRMEEFGRLALNSGKAQLLIYELKDKYKL